MIDQTLSDLYPVIMAGGSGTRFWPLSRQNLPKQFLPIGTKEPLLSETMRRLDGVTRWSTRYIVAGVQHVEGVHTLCPQLPSDQLLIEPCARNTAPCVGLAAIHIAQRAPDGVMIVLPSDHHITDIQAFHQAISTATIGARSGKMITFGIKPTRPETGYGYIKYPGGGESHQSRLNVERFVEKPPLSIAEEYVRSGKYLWNSGVFFFTARRILNDIKIQLPELSEALEEIQRHIGLPTYSDVLTHVFNDLQSISIDVGVMEGAQEVEVIPVDFGWNDVGHWAALGDFAPLDVNGNIAQGGGEHILIDAHQNIIHSSTPVAMIGVEDLVLVNTQDVILACTRQRAQEVKRVVEILKQSGRDDLL